ncbi:hypothetical protein EON65_29905 [archaeon]|nr:MAG: hypothetical protein EON65_29905 [archaeon]
MHRFLGFDVKSITNHYVAFLGDAILLILLVVVWKPLALLLIYIELFCRLLVLALFTLVDSMWELFPHNFLQSCIQRLYIASLPDFVGIAFLRKQALHVPKRLQRIKVLQELWECTTCIGSLSLLLRFIAVAPAGKALSQHHRLAKHSILYRVFRHII